MSLRLPTIVVWLLWSMALSAQVGLSPDESRLFNLVNQERKKAGLPQFQWDYHLAEAARTHTQLMSAREELTHQLSGEPVLGDRIGAAGARFDGAAENVAEGDVAADTVEVLHGSLMNSPGHRANLLSPKYNAIGLAIVSRDGATYVTEDFAHTVTTYSDEQFRAAIIAAFNKARQANSLPAIAIREDSRIHDFACSESDPPQFPSGFSGALNEVVFTSSEPEKLPPDMQKAARNASLHKVSLGACFHPDKQHGYANFWVIAAFYP